MLGGDDGGWEGGCDGGGAGGMLGGDNGGWEGGCDGGGAGGGGEEINQDFRAAERLIPRAHLAMALMVSGLLITFRMK